MEIHSVKANPQADTAQAKLNVQAAGSLLSAPRPEVNQALGGVMQSVVAGLGRDATYAPAPFDGVGDRVGDAADRASDTTAASNNSIWDIFEKFNEKMEDIKEKQAKTKEQKALKEIEQTFGSEVADLAAKSPTLRADLAKLEAEGWEIKEGNPGGGSYANSDSKEIVLDPNMDANTTVQTLAHETGHAKDTSGVDTSSREAYLRTTLDGEGYATINNIEVQREIQAAGGPDIGIAGNHDAQYEQAYEQGVKSGDMDKAADDIGQIFGKGERTSTTGQTYEDYYGGYYDAHLS